MRKRRSSMENLYALKTAAEKEMSRKNEKMFVLYADLKAAFDRVNRHELW